VENRLIKNEKDKFNHSNTIAHSWEQLKTSSRAMNQCKNDLSGI